jgi:hypothetical protein
MPRANRHLVPGRVWHITHRCHNFKRRIVNWSKQDSEIVCMNASRVIIPFSISSFAGALI